MRTGPQLAFQATHDLLTGLANRARLLDEVESQLPAAAPGHAPVLLFVDRLGGDEFVVVCGRWAVAPG